MTTSALPSAYQGADSGTRTLNDAERAELASWTTATMHRLAHCPTREAETLRAEVVTRHLWLANSIARRYFCRGEEADDLRQVAYRGLVEAVRRCDPDQDSFLAFAVVTVSGVLKRHFRDHGWLIRPPRPTQQVAAELRAHWDDIAQRTGGEPDARQMAEGLQRSVAEVREATRASQGYGYSSLDEVMGDSWGKLADARSHDFSAIEARIVVSEALRQLDDQDRELLVMRYVEERSQSDIAAIVDSNQMQISRRLARLLDQLRTIIGSLDEVPGPREPFEKLDDSQRHATRASSPHDPGAAVGATTSPSLASDP